MTEKYIAGYNGSLMSRSAKLSIRSAISSVSLGVALVDSDPGASGFEQLALFSFFNFFFSVLKSWAISSSSSESEASSELVLVSSYDEASVGI